MKARPHKSIKQHISTCSLTLDFTTRLCNATLLFEPFRASFDIIVLFAVFSISKLKLFNDEMMVKWKKDEGGI